MDNDYEIALVLDPTITNEEETNLINSFEESIKKFKGLITKTENPGRQKLAYPIKHHKEGIYYFFSLQISPDAINKVVKFIRLNEKAIRYLILSLDKQKNKAKRLEKIFKRSKQIESKSQENFTRREV